MKRFPWWGSVILAVAAYYGLKYGIPKFMPIDSSTARFLALLAPLAAMALLLLAGKQLYDGTEDQGTDDPRSRTDGEE